MHNASLLIYCTIYAVFFVYRRLKILQDPWEEVSLTILECFFFYQITSPKDLKFPNIL